MSNREIKTEVKQYKGVELVTATTFENGIKLFSNRYVNHNGNIKGLVIASASKKPLMEMPYIINGFDNQNQEQWYCALTDDNPPEKVKFSGAGYDKIKWLESKLEGADFNRPVDDLLVAEIRANFFYCNKPKAAQIDAEDIEQDNG